ncbi:MAG: hypothetical protein JXQ71_04585 [Verrucomicrobia bacterium]|nr:hypothetical protein [Verrucomicrobiota bacterium]
MARWQSCNVLHVAQEGREVWQFNAASAKCNLLRHESKLPAEPLPAKLVAKDWQTLFQPRLNVAWLPADQVFLRTLQLPAGELAETRSMLELQLEKLSPLPVAQIVWSFEVFPQPTALMQTAVVVIIARALVEDYLGRLETAGFLADRLELPLLDELRAAEIDANGVWIHPEIGLDKSHCLMAWWIDRVLCHLSLVCLPNPEQRGAVLREQLAQTAWAGEIEGWLTGPPALKVVADPAAAAPWLVEFIRAENAEVVPPVAHAELAARTARRVTKDSAHTNLLPAEHTARYKQQWVDGVWMRGLGALLVLYLLFVLGYFGVVEYARWKLESLRDQVAQLEGAVQNAKRTRALVETLQEQVDLQYAALECWKAVAANLPEELTLDSLNFERGVTLVISGTVEEQHVPKVHDFNEAIRSTQVNNQPLFSNVKAPDINRGVGNRSRWHFPCELKRTDVE